MVSADLLLDASLVLQLDSHVVDNRADVRSEGGSVAGLADDRPDGVLTRLNIEAVDGGVGGGGRGISSAGGFRRFFGIDESEEASGENRDDGDKLHFDLSLGEESRDEGFLEKSIRGGGIQKGDMACAFSVTRSLYLRNEGRLLRLYTDGVGEILPLETGNSWY